MTRLTAQPRAYLDALAARVGVSFDDLYRGLEKRPLWLTPGKTVQGEKPLPIGSRVNLRREMPGTHRAKLDQGWVVCGYRQDTEGRWNGYGTHRGPLLETGILGRAEAFDLVEQYEIPAE